MKWAYVVVWRDVKQRNTAVVVDLYLTIRFVACSVVCASRRARPRAGPGAGPGRHQASPNIDEDSQLQGVACRGVARGAPER